MAGRWDWIARAGVPTEVTRRLQATRGRLGRWLARQSGADATRAALRDTIDWQRARLDYLEMLVTRLAHDRPARPWRGAGERPVLLLGSGGGGTRVLAEAAVRLGVVLGTRVNESFDSVEWAPLVYEMILAADGAAAAPRGPDAIRSLAEAIYAPWLSEHGRWGIKLPELLPVLPHFLAAFPDAQVVLLTRHPLAAALRRSHVTTQAEHPLGRVVLDAAYRAAGRDPGRIASDPQYLRNALVWRDQIGRAWQTLAALPPTQGLHLRLEDFARVPDQTPARLAAHLGLPPVRQPLAIDASRLAVPRADARAAEILALCGALAAQLGYAPDGVAADA